MSAHDIQMLVATMDQPKGDFSLLEKMNIQSDAIVCNQCDRFSVDEFSWKGHSIRWFCFNERGVGLNRNNALMRATADFVVFCDDDMVFADGYPGLLRQGFGNTPRADILVFNLDGRRPETRAHRVGRFGFLRYGAARIAARTASLKRQGLLFNLCFGGGTEHAHGEDSIFLSDCLKKGLHIRTLPVFLARLADDRPSTWRNGLTDKFFIDQGAMFRQVSPGFWPLWCFQDAVRHQKLYGRNWCSALGLMFKEATP
jgi:glycosyltransferase involved in cell wall biosynthesis